MGWFSPSSSKLNWSLLSDENILQDLVKLSFSENVLIFKHSTRCSISTMSKNRLESVGEDSKIKNCFLLDVLKYREISTKIETDFKVIHESPQILVIQNAKCVYHASHNEISWDSIP
jgi:bacillithiol system protein YtxJ